MKLEQRMLEGKLFIVSWSKRWAYMVVRRLMARDRTWLDGRALYAR